MIPIKSEMNEVWRKTRKDVAVTYHTYKIILLFQFSPVLHLWSGCYMTKTKYFIVHKALLFITSFLTPQKLEVHSTLVGKEVTR
jgi:hypothetical protein